MSKLTFQTIWVACFSIFLKTLVISQAPNWSVNPSSFVNNMTLTAQVIQDGSEQNGNNNLLAAFVGNEVRGVASPFMVGTKAYYFLTIHSNVVFGETVNFRVYLAPSNSVHPALEKIDFLKNSQAGSYPDGYAVNISTDNDFPIELLSIPPSNTLAGYPFSGIELEHFLSSMDKDPVVWSVINGINLQGTVDAGNVLTVTPLNPAWTGTDSVLVTATETGTANAFSASKFARFTIGPDYGDPVFGEMPVRFLQTNLPLPDGDLNDFLDFDGPCVEFSVEMMLPEGTDAMPVWPQPNTNSGTMSLVVQPDFGGNQIVGASNKLAAFVNGIIAGVANPQTVLGKELYFLTLANVGKGEVVLKLYNADNQYIHEKTTGINFLPTSALGDFNHPFVVDFAPFLINLSMDGSWTSTVLDPNWFGEQHVMFFARDCKYGEKIGSIEMVFLLNQCLSEMVVLPEGATFCLAAEADVSDVTWFLDGNEIGAGTFFGASESGVYQYEGLTPLGCPDVKSCPILITDASILIAPTGSATAGRDKSIQPPCGSILLADITLDDTPPTASCKSATIFLNNLGEVSLTTADVNNGSFTACGMADISLSQVNFNCLHVGPNAVVLTIEDAAGRTANCTATVSVKDPIAPSVSCKNLTVLLNANGSAAIAPAAIFLSGSDNCGAVNLVSAIPNSFNCNNIGANSVVLTVNDGNGNMKTCNSTVTVRDSTKPTVTCKNHSVALSSNGSASITPGNVFLSGFDNCGTINLVSVVPNSFNCSKIGGNAVTLTVNDGNGNTKTCTATVTVVDNTPPTVTCKNHTAALNSSGTTTFTPSHFYQAGNDNCGTVNLVSVVPGAFGCANIGSHSVTLTVNDGHGNTKTCSATVTVVDNIAPMAKCPSPMPVVLIGTNGTGFLPANIGNGSSTDNCNLVETSPARSFTCNDTGPHSVTLTASDGKNSSAAICFFNVVDQVAPTAKCTTQIISANFNADGGYTIDPNNLNNGSSDICGISSLSAIPASFNCQNEGLNTVTLKVTDFHGNSSTCTAQINMAEYLTLNGVTPFPEGCAGAGDGAITIYATAGGGQLGYSIDGGVNFLFTNTFINLSPGSYEIKVKVFGIPNTCTESTTVTVAAGGATVSWYKDTDNDGYSDGITQVSCAQPSGYKLFSNLQGPQTDCNDNNPLEKPGQVWYPDIDGDGYGTATSVTQCSRPSGHKAYAELAGPETDCNDAKSAIHPGATEICNNIDDDCDGEVDEGLSGVTYVGNVSFSNQAQVNAWSACFDTIQGNLTINGAGINNLLALGNLAVVTGNLTIQNTTITNMQGMNSLDSLGGTMTLYYNGQLTTLLGLESLTRVNGLFRMYYNFKLSDCCAVHDLINGGVTGAITIFYNKVGCNSVAQINNACAHPNPLIGGTSRHSINLSEPQNTVVKEVILFPNPAKGVFTLMIPDEWQAGEIIIMDIHGRSVVERSIMEGQTVYQIDGGQLTPGIFMICIKSSGQPAQVKRLLIE